MKTFAVRSFFFLLPLMLVFGFLTYVLFRAGELTSISKLIKEDEPVLLGLAYSNPDKYLKLQAVLEKKPSVLVLGTSRVMQFRGAFFKDPSRFYNAGGGVETGKQFRQFLEAILVPGEPDIMIIGLDHYFFNEGFRVGQKDDWVSREPHLGAVWQNGAKGLLLDYAKGKVSLSDVFADQDGVQRIGFSAFVNDSGFLVDGSYHYGKIIEEPETNPDYEFRDTFQRIEQGNRRFQYAQDVSQEAVGELEEFLKRAEERDIYVIGFLPPYAHVVYEKMMSMDDKYAYIEKLQGTLEPLFDAHQFTLYDFTDLASLGASDKETTDGFHGSEKAYLRLFLEMAKDDKMLRQYVDVDYLEKRLHNTEGDHYVFEI